jgi:hypothetical protein
LVFVITVVALLAWGVYALLPYPDQPTIERRLRQNLPPGHEDLFIFRWERSQGELAFNVLYRDYGDLIGVRYEVRRWWNALNTAYISVQVTRIQLGVPRERWTLVDLTFALDGTLTSRNVGAATPGEGERLEQRARQIALAVAKAY